MTSRTAEPPRSAILTSERTTPSLGVCQQKRYVGDEGLQTITGRRSVMGSAFPQRRFQLHMFSTGITHVAHVAADDDMSTAAVAVALSLAPIPGRDAS
jgi:hypothetical protein